MSLVKPGKARSQIYDRGKNLEIVIPAKRKYAMMVFISLWLIGWAFGEFVLPFSLFRSTLDTGVSLFLLVWLALWTAGGAIAFLTLGWNISGQEIVTVTEDRLQIAQKIFGIGPLKEYQLADVKNMRIDSNLVSERSIFNLFDNSRQRGFVEPGTIKFDYGSKTFRFARGVDEAEAKMIINELRERGVA